MEVELDFKQLNPLQQYITPTEIKGIIFTLVELNYSANSIHNFIVQRGFQLTKQTVINISKQVKNGEWISNKSNCGRKKTFTQEEEDNLVKQVKQNPSLSVSELSRNSDLNPNQATRQTINNIMLKNKLRAYSPYYVLGLLKLTNRSNYNGAFRGEIGPQTNSKRLYFLMNHGCVPKNSILIGQDEKKEKNQEANTFLEEGRLLQNASVGCYFLLKS